MVIYLIRGPEKVLIFSCSSESLRITWNKKIKFGLQDYVPPVPHCSVKSNIRTQSRDPRMWLSASWRKQRTKMSSLVAEYDPVASQEKQKSSITSLTEEPQPFLHTHTHTHACTHTHTHTHTPIHRVPGPVPSKSTLFLEMPRAQAKGSREQSADIPRTQNLVYLHAVQFNKGRLSITGRSGTHAHQLTSWPKTHRHVRDVELHGCLGTSCRDVL